MTRWNPISRGEKPYIGFENETIKIAYAYIKRKNRKPEYCVHTEGVVYRFDSHGYANFLEHIRDAGSPLSDLGIFDEYDEPAVINGVSMFSRKFYMNRHRWQLTPKDIQKIVYGVF